MCGRNHEDISFCYSDVLTCSKEHMKMKKYSTFKNIVYTHKYILGTSLYKYIICATIIILSGIMATFLTTLLPAFVINILSLKKDYTDIFLVLSIYFIFMCAISIFSERFKSRIDNSISFTRMFKGLDYYKHIISTNYENIDSESGRNTINAGIDSYFDGDHEGFQHILLDLRTLIQAVLGLIAYSVLTAYRVNIILPIILVIVSSCTIFVNMLSSKWVYNHKNNWTKIDTKLRYISTQTISSENAKDIRMYRMKVWLSDVYNTLINHRLSWSRKEAKLNQIVLIFERLLIAVKYIIIFIAIFYEVNNGLTAGDFVLTLGLMIGINQWTMDIFNSIKYLQSNNILVNSTRHCLEMDTDQNKVQKSENEKLTFTNKLRLNNISFSFPNGNKKIFDNFNLSIKKGEKVAIVGLNGAGKTTLVKLICGLYPPTSGEIYLDNTQINSVSNNDYTNLFSAIFQDFNVFALSLKENVACCMEDKIDINKVHSCLAKAGLSEKVNEFANGLDSMMLKELDEDGVVLSGGETQKLMLARCLYKDAKIIILDEPTAALDALAENELYEQYASLTKDKTSIFISHRLNSTKFCDRIIMLDQGRIIEEGTHNELMQNKGKYAELYSLQASYYKKEA